MSTSSDVRLREAEGLLEHGHGQQALAQVDELLRQEPANTDAWYVKGVCLFRLQAFVESQQAFERIVSSQPGSTQAHYYLGLSKERQGGLETAIPHYRRVLELQPNHPEALEKLKSAGIDAAPGPPAVGGPGSASLRDAGDLLLRRHRRMRSFSFMFLSAIAAFLLAIVAGMTEGEDVAVVSLMVSGGLFVAAALRSALTVYTFYERRIDIQKGVLFRVQRSIWVYEIEDTSLTRSPLDLLTGDASVHVRGAFSAPGWTSSKKPGRFKFRGAGNHRKMQLFWRELRDLQIEQRREMKNWFI